MRIKFDTVVKCSEITSFIYIEISILIQETLTLFVPYIDLVD